MSYAGIASIAGIAGIAGIADIASIAVIVDLADTLRYVINESVQNNNRLIIIINLRYT